MSTWAYQRGGKKLETFGMDYDEMYQKLYEAYHLAADRNHTLIADVGKKFYELSDKVNLYADDGCHPNEKRFPDSSRDNCRSLDELNNVI